jgi:PAS domain S-box-containing protein
VTAVLGLFEDITGRKRVEQSLKDARDRLEEAQRAAHLGNWEWDARNDQITGSEEFYRLFDVAPEGLSRFSQFVERLHPDDRERVQRDVADALKQDRPYDTDYRVSLSDGGWRDIIARGRVFVDEGGKPLRMVGTCLDITERKQAEDEVRRLNSELEQRVRDRTAQLEESNKELEAFSYSVSHDLRAPLRAIDGFTRILTGDYAPQLDTEGQRVCSVIHENTRKMSQLIDDLLAFSRLGRTEMSLSPIDMATMANSVFHELTTPESRAHIDFQVGVLPPAVADPTLMRQVWMNLLSNAIKFSSKRERAIIRVSAQQSQGENVYVVQDHGAGFEMQYVGKLFGVFQRLHTSREFEGTGVGLALVQRVVRRHGGRVWAEGESDKGATFYFALQQRGA